MVKSGAASPISASGIATHDGLKSDTGELPDVHPTFAFPQRGVALPVPTTEPVMEKRNSIIPDFTFSAGVNELSKPTPTGSSPHGIVQSPTFGDTITNDAPFVDTSGGISVSRITE